MDKVKNFILKYKVGVTIILLVIASFSIYFFANADEDIYANQIEVVDETVSIITGTANVDGNFDADDEPGNDSSSENLIVRNFDQITYDISHGFAYKEDSTLEEEEKAIDTTRTVIIDVLIPSSLNARVSDYDPVYEGQAVEPKDITINEVEYKYYMFEYEDESLSDTNTESIVISNINAKNGDVITPIIRVREETDENAIAIEDVTDISEIKALTISEVTVSAKEEYGIKLYSGVVQKDKTLDVSTLPVGIAVYVPNDSNKGIKGIQIPTEVNFKLTLQSDISDSSIIYSEEDTEDNPKIGNYNGKDYVIDLLPISYDVNNGKSTIDSVESINVENTSVFNIKINDLHYNTNTIPIDEEATEFVKYLSTKAFVVKTQRTSGSKKDINYTITSNVENSNQIAMLDNYVEFVGDYLSKVDFINSSNIESNENTTGPVLTTPGQAIYNYGEEFYIQNTITYGLKQGDTLENGFTNYIKIDNTAMKLIDVGNVSDETLDYYVEFNNNETELLPEVKYGIGEWNSNYFVKKSDAPSYCPATVPNDKEQLMNLYGGPCIEANNNVKWYDSIEDAATANENNRNKIIVFKFNINEEYAPGVKTIIRLKAQAVKNYNNIGKTFQVVARGETVWNKKAFYLSETPKYSLSDLGSDITYKKSIYTNGELTATDEPNNKYGNSIYVSSHKSFINNITVYDSHDSMKTTIYAGVNDPIQITVNPVIYKSDFDATISGAKVYLYLPNSLEIYLKTGDKVYSNKTSTVIDGITYNIYEYRYSENDIKYDNESISGTIPNLNVHAYIALDTIDNTTANIIAQISGTLKPNKDATTVYVDGTPIQNRTSQMTINLRNLKSINSIGKSNLVYIDANSSYEYNMRASNLVEDSAKLELLNILPYSGDGVGTGSEYSGTINVAIKETLHSGYTAYYKKDNHKTILSSELNKNSSVNWIKWDNYNTLKSNITAVKVVANSLFNKGTYFMSKNGLTLTIKTKNNKQTEKYNNKFYIIQKDAEVCISDDMTSECTKKELKNISYVSNVSEVSVYNRTISGKAFEDANYNGFSNKGERVLRDVIVELYKLNATEFDALKPSQAISDKDELISDDLTSNKGTYKFNGLSSGNYYVKYTFDCDKYTVTEKNKQDPTIEGDASIIDSDAEMVEIYKEVIKEENKDSESRDESIDNSTSQDTEQSADEDKETEKESEVEYEKKCFAVSNIITLNNNNIESKNIDLGLRIRQEFDIKLNKYITKVVVKSNKGTQTYDYNNQSKVKIDVKNLKNTSFRVSYGIEIENSKYFPGTIGNIIETIPEGMTFNPDLIENDGWVESDGKLYYTDLTKTLIMPGEKYHLTIVLDLVTDNGGDFINFVAANNLTIKPVVTNFLEIPEYVPPVGEEIPEEDVEQEEGE